MKTQLVLTFLIIICGNCDEIENRKEKTYRESELQARIEANVGYATPVGQ